MTFNEIIRALLRRWVSIVVVLVVAVAVGVLILAAQGKQYRAETRVLLTQSSLGTSGSEGLLTQQKLTLLAVTYADLVGAPGFIQSAERQAGMTPGSESVTGDVQVNSAIVHIAVNGPSADRVVSLARALQSALRSAVASLPSASSGPMTGIEVQFPAASTVSHSPALVLSVAAAVGLSLAVTLVLLLEGQ